MIDIDIPTGVGFAVLLSAIVQLFIKPGIFTYYGGKDQAEESHRYPFLVNIATFTVAEIIAAAVLFVQSQPVDAAGWVTLGLASFGAAVMGTLGSIGVESVASNTKRFF